MLTASKDKSVTRIGQYIYIAWPNLAWTRGSTASGPWFFVECPSPPNSNNNWNILFEVHENNLAEEPLELSSRTGPCVLRLKCTHNGGAIALTQVLRNLGAKEWLDETPLRTRGLEETLTDSKCTAIDECTECWGTGRYKGWGASCSKGCTR